MIFGILTNKNGPLSKVLPYQAKLALKDAYLKLLRANIKVRVGLVTLGPKVITRRAGSHQPAGAIAS